MNFIIEFYQGLDALNTIIFWGVIIIILLLLVFSIVMINKNHKLKHELDNKNSKDDDFPDEIALPTNNNETLIMKDEQILIKDEENKNFEPFVPKVEPSIEEPIAVEKEFKAEEHVIEYDNDLFNLPHVKKNTIIEEPSLEKNPVVEPQPKKQPLEIPTKPYERNVLREMSLNQTSPIGIIKNNEQTVSYSPPKLSVKPNNELTANTNANETESLVLKSANQDNSLNQELTETSGNNLKTLEQNNQNLEIPKNENELDINSNVVSTIVQEEHQTNEFTNNSEKPTTSVDAELEFKKMYRFSEKPQEDINIPVDESDEEAYEEEFAPVTEYLENEALKELPDIKKNEFLDNNDNQTFIEEVSKKLASVETLDEIDRTEYEIEQEENAIISYKELMEKKDTIQTIDEEAAVISIKELVNRKKEEEKLYKLTGNEENTEFIDELKKFRDDLK